MFSRCYIIWKKYMFFPKLVLKYSLCPEPGDENGDKKFRSASVVKLTTVFEFCEILLSSFMDRL